MTAPPASPSWPGHRAPAAAPSPPVPPVAAAPPPQPVGPFFAGGQEEELLPFGGMPQATSRTAAPETVARPRSNWLGLAAMYICGMIVGYLLARFTGVSGPARTGLERIPDDYGIQKGGRAWKGPAANSPVPPKQKAALGESLRVGNLEVTAMGVERRKVNKLRLDLVSGQRQKMPSEGECLVLRVRFKNVSSDIAFSPLDALFVRRSQDYPTYTFLEVGDGHTIDMFDLAPFSEFDIEGQPFDETVPGQELEAVIAAEEGSPARAKGTMLWRLQVRTGGSVAGVARTFSTVVGFTFTADQIRPGKA
jgi:hypothetical protein